MGEYTIHSELVLIGSINKASGKGETVGTGILLEYSSNVYIATCRHVFLETKNKKDLFAIPKLKKTLNPKNGYSIINLDIPFSHKDESANSTYDIVIFKVSTPKNVLYENGINPIILSEKYCENDATKEYYIKSFPVDHVENNFKENNEEILFPKVIKGKLENIDISIIDQEGFCGRLKEGKYLKIKETESMGKGSSGGLVYCENELEHIIPVGVILGSIDVMTTYKDGTKEKIYGIIFGSILRVLEIIKSI